jgi:hypothetical protein
MTAPIVDSAPDISPGDQATVSLPLPPGVWDLSLQYVSDVDVKLSSEGRHWTMPAYVGRPGPIFDVGTVTGNGTASPVRVSLYAARPSALSGADLYALPHALMATPHPGLRHLVPLKNSCRRYIDWFQLG